MLRESPFRKFPLPNGHSIVINLHSIHSFSSDGDGATEIVYSNGKSVVVACNFEAVEQEFSATDVSTVPTSVNVGFI